MKTTYYGAWNTLWKQMDEYKTKPVKEWKVRQLIGYYYSHTGENIIRQTYDEAVKSGWIDEKDQARHQQPGENKEIKTMENVYRKMNKDAEKIKLFMDWLIDNKKISHKTGFKNIYKLASEYEYEQFMNANTAINRPNRKRTDLLPANVAALFTDFTEKHGEIKTFCNLAFALPSEREVIILRLATINETIETLNLEGTLE